MPFWRKNNEGFEWNKYVRTTVLVRRQKRREKIEEAGAAAAFGVRQAKWKTAAHLKAAASALGRGLVATGRGVKSGTRSSWHYLAPRALSAAKIAAHGMRRGGAAVAIASRNGLSKGAQGAGIGYANYVRPAVGSLAGKAAHASRPLRQNLSKPELFGPLAIITVIAVLGATAHVVRTGVNAESLFVVGLAVALLGILILAWPTNTTWSLTRPRCLHREAFSISSRTWLKPAALAIPAIAVLAGAAFWAWPSDQRGWPTAAIPDLVPKIDVPNIEVSAINPFKSEVISGRARAIDGGHIRIGKQILRLDNIEALLPAQTCKTARGHSWRCGTSARRQLSRLVRGGTVDCTVTGTDDDGVKRTKCMKRDTDIAEQLVASGYAFANLGLFASYKTSEQQAREQKRGLWQGASERPSDVRMAQWDQAATSAPEKCPIKGQVVRRQKLYVLPWDRGYSRVRVRERRGGQWFCSEQQARAAGFERKLLR